LASIIAYAMPRTPPEMKNVEGKRRGELYSPNSNQLQ